MTQHIGIVVCSAEGASLCHLKIRNEDVALLGPNGDPEVSMHTPSLSHYVACLNRGAREGIAKLMLASARSLVDIGVDFLICLNNIIHTTTPNVALRSPPLWLCIGEMVVDEAVARGWVRQSP